MASDSTAIVINPDALTAAAAALRQQHDDSLQALNTFLSKLEDNLHQLAQYVPNVIDHARGEHAIIQKRGSTLLGYFANLADNLDDVADEAIPLHAHTRGRLGQIE